MTQFVGKAIPNWYTRFMYCVLPNIWIHESTNWTYEYMNRPIYMLDSYVVRLRELICMVDVTRSRQRERENAEEIERERGRDGERGQEREKERERERERQREKEREKDKDRERGRERETYEEGERETERSRSDLNEMQDESCLIQMESCPMWLEGHNARDKMNKM